MIKALLKGRNDQGNVNFVLFGLCYQNLEKLRQGQAIRFVLEEHLPDVDRDAPIEIFLFADETEEKIMKHLEERFTVHKVTGTETH